MNSLKLLFLIMCAAVVACAVYVYAGAYDIGADVPHSRIALSILSAVRDRSIEQHARDVQVPASLNDPQQLLIGAGQYAAMCSGCHLAPGYERNETWEGMYPQPPRLALGTKLNPAETFWVIKHGIKMSGMPAWGVTHDDDTLWAITAFVRTLPKLTAQQYREIVLRAPTDDDMTKMPMPGSAEGEEHRHHH